MNKICDSFNKCSKEIKKWMLKQLEVKEESLTDYFLYNLSELIPTIKYIQFSRIEEGRKTGADWEWWFVFSNKNSFATRVQAKKLKANKDNYPSIAYTSNGQLQIEQLLDDSTKDGFASFYAFYSYEEHPKIMCRGKLESNGVYFGEANKLRQEFILKSRRTLMPNDILEFTNPLSCLFCCPITFEQLDIERGFRNYLNEYYPSFSDLNDDNRNELGFRQTPNYILQLIENEKIPEWWESEYRNYLNRINALVVVDMRYK